MVTISRRNQVFIAGLAIALVALLSLGQNQALAADAPKEKVKVQLAGRVTLKEETKMIPHLTFDPNEKQNKG